MSLSLIILIITFILTKTQNVIENSELTEGSNYFCYDLTEELYTNLSTNIWISPFCIESCFALIYPGSAGTTQTEIANVMYFPNTTSNAVDVTQQFFRLQASIETTYDGESDNRYHKSSIINIANKIYISDLLTVSPTYIAALANNITKQSFIDQDFDFGASNATTIINDWVDEKTNGLIDSIIDEDKDISQWLLAALNAIYLNGSFASPFQTNLTSAQAFYSDGLRTDELSDIHLMHQVDYFDYYSDGNYQFLKFPFTDMADLFVLFALPINSQLYVERNGLITDESFIQTAIENLEKTYIALAIPKISVAETYELKEQLQAMGMITSFDTRADFSNLADVRLYIDTVIHKTMIEMDEYGLVAAAITLIAMVKSGPLPTDSPPLLFKADHPFQMFIIDGAHDNVILFSGQINNPGIPKGSETPIYEEPIGSIWNDFTLYTQSTNPPHSTNSVDTTGNSESTMTPTGVASSKSLIVSIICIVAIMICVELV